MKYIALSFMLLSASAAVATPTDSLFTLKGKLSGVSGETKIFLRYIKGNSYKVDSVLTSDGTFTFKGAVAEPVKAMIYTPSDKHPDTRAGKDFYLEAGSLKVTADKYLASAVIEGSRTENESQEWKKKTEAILEQMSQLRKEQYFMRQRQPGRDSLKMMRDQLAELRMQYGKMEIEFIRKYPASYVSWDLVKNESYSIEPGILEPAMKAIAPVWRNSTEGKQIAGRLAIAKKTWIGSKALPFSQPNVEGKNITLASFKGKYVLIDFWASWCGICRLENPNVLKAYNAFKDKGFTVLGVSLDDAEHKDAWIKAIKDDGMPWEQVCDLKGRQNEIAVLYGIKGIPQNVIVDPNGVIVAKNLRDYDLMEKLDELINK